MQNAAYDCCNSQRPMPILEVLRLSQQRNEAEKRICEGGLRLKMMSLKSCVTCKPFVSAIRSKSVSVQAKPVLAKQSRAVVTRASSEDKQSQDSAFLESSTAIFAAAGLLTPLLADVESALAQKGEYGIVEGRIASLTHPILMGFLFVSSLYTAWLGFQWRRTRTLPDQIKELKAELPKPDSEGNRPSNPALENEIAELEKTRKELSKGNFRTQHWNWGSLLLGVGVIISLVGPVNTYIRLGKLFPGPHLYAGAGIVGLWASAAALVPAMQRGNDAARTLHITLNCVNIALFAWQVPTGLEIVGKVLQFTSFP